MFNFSSEGPVTVRPLYVVLLVLVLVVSLIGMGFAAFHFYKEWQNAHTVALATEKQMTDYKTIMDKFNMSQADSIGLAKKYADYQAGKIAPATVTYFTAPTVGQAATDIEKKLSSGKTVSTTQADGTVYDFSAKSLMAKYKADKVAVVGNTTKQRVEVIPITEDKVHGIGEYITTENYGLAYRNKAWTYMAGQKFKAAPSVSNTSVGVMHMNYF